MPILAIINADTIKKYALPVACLLIGSLIISIIIQVIRRKPIVTPRYNKALRKRRRIISFIIWLSFMALMALALFDRDHFDRERIKAFILLGIGGIFYILRGLVVAKSWRRP